MARAFTQNISDTECIGDSLIKINNNSESLDTRVQQLSSYDSSLRAAITPSSNSLIVANNLTVNNILSAGSNIRTNTIQNLQGNNLFVNGYPRQPGQIIEYLTSPCDGSTVTGESGTYTLQAVTGVQNLTDTFTDITGSTITYTPPAAATRVLYRFNVMIGSNNTQTINAWRLMVDGTEITYAKRAYSAHSYYDDGSQFEWTFGVGGTTDTNMGRFSTWTLPKKIKLQARKWPGNYSSSIHTAYHYPGLGNGTTRPLMKPTLTIIAIA